MFKQGSFVIMSTVRIRILIFTVAFVITFTLIFAAMFFVVPTAIPKLCETFFEHKLTEKDIFLQPQVRQQQISSFSLDLADISR